MRKLTKKDEEALRQTSSILSVALFAAQARGLIKFPQGPKTIGEIDSDLNFVIAAFFAKAEEYDL